MSRPGEADEAAFLRSFEDCTLPAARFRHEDHVRLAWLMLGEADLPEALRRFWEGLKRYAVVPGQARPLPRDHHRRLPAAHPRAAGAGARERGFAAFAARNPDLLTWRPSVLARYYREETLASDRARRTFLLPDRLEPCPPDAARRA